MRVGRNLGVPALAGLPNGRLTAVLPPNTFRDEMHNDTHKRILMTAVQGLEACQTRG